MFFLLTVASCLSCATTAVNRHNDKYNKLGQTLPQPDFPTFNGFSIGRSPCRDANGTTPLWISNSPFDEDSKKTPEQCRELCDRSWRNEHSIFRCAAFMIGPADPSRPGKFEDCTLYADSALWDRIRAKLEDLGYDVHEVDAWITKELGLGWHWGTLDLPTQQWGCFTGSMKESARFNAGYPCYVREASSQPIVVQEAQANTKSIRSSAAIQANPEFRAWAVLSAAVALL